MKLERAIEILTESVTTGYYGNQHNFTEAKKFGIEALKAWKENRQYYPLLEKYWLPGETKE